MQTVIEHRSSQLGTTRLCDALGVPRSTLYRRLNPGERPQSSGPRKRSPRATSEQEREAVLSELHSQRFIDRSPMEVYHTLLEQGRYLCSPRTMYRLLEANAEVRERRNQLRHPKHSKPELVATAPNQVWSWDISKLKGPGKWLYFYLFVILDIFSRYAVAWMIAEHENAKLAQRLIRCACQKHGVEPGTLVLHNDRGSPMKAKTTTQLVASLGVEHSFSRPHVSNDNPFSESQFKTCKYHPGFPERFGSMADAMSFGRRFFDWYNEEHRHSGINYLTPRQVHYGLAQQVLAQRHETLLHAYRQHPERFVKGPPKMPELPTAVWINRPADPEKDPGAGVPVVSPPSRTPPLEAPTDPAPPLPPKRKIPGVQGTESPASTTSAAEPGVTTPPDERPSPSSGGDRLPPPQGAQVASQQSPILPAGTNGYTCDGQDLQGQAEFETRSNQYNEARLH